MRRTSFEKSKVLREGYIKGLRQAQRIINEMIEGDDSRLIQLLKKIDKLSFQAASVDPYIEECKSMIDEGIDLNVTDENGNTPLHLAAKIGEPSICRKLLHAEARLLNKKNDDNETALYIAWKQGNGATCRELKSWGAK